MDLAKMKKDLTIRGKNGLPFLLAAAIVWIVIAIIFLTPLDIQWQNILMLAATGLTFPLALLLAKLIKAEWKFKDNPLSKLGLYLNLAQFVYFPVILWAFAQRPSVMVLFFAIITGAHLFPFGWLYNTKAYYAMAPVTSVGVMLIGWTLSDILWAIPLSMIGFLAILASWLYRDYQMKRLG